LTNATIALFSHRAFETLLAIFENGKCYWAMVTMDARGGKECCRRCSEQTTEQRKDLHAHAAWIELQAHI
jgi:hypothetical protein